MFVKTFPVGPFQCNCTIIGDPESGEALVVDPGAEPDRITDELKKKGFNLVYLLHTHAHLDHIGATKKIKDQLGGKIALHKDDLYLYDNLHMQAEMFGLSMDTETRPVDHYLVHGDQIEWGKKHRVEVLHTPGHTPGSLCFRVNQLADNKDFLFTGDTLFMSSIGRTDLWGGDYGQIMDSIKSKLMKLDDSIPVIPGHGPNTTIGEERRGNPFLK